MGIREWANKNQKQAAAAASGLTLLAVGAIVYQVLASRQRYPTEMPNSFYTVDDGKTWFVDKADARPPFDHGGGQAVRAYVFAGPDGKKFCGYLERYTAETKKQLAGGQTLTPYLMRYGREIKRPGQTVWVKTGDLKKEAAVQDFKAPDGSDQSQLVMIDPN